MDFTFSIEYLDTKIRKIPEPQVLATIEPDEKPVHVCLLKRCSYSMFFSGFHLPIMSKSLMRLE